MTYQGRQTVSIDAIKDALLARIDSVVHQYAPPANGSYTKQGVYFTLNPGRHDRSVGSFAVRMTGADAGRWNDYATGAHGDLIDLIGLSLNLTPAQALAEARNFLGLSTETPDQRRAREAAGVVAKQRRAQQQREAREKAERRAKAALGLWLSGQEGLRGTPVAEYLAARGLDLARLGRQPRALRYHPETLYFDEWVDPETGEVIPRRVKMPAMVSAITNGAGQHIATHRTYLARDPAGVWRKAGLPDAKKVLGDFRGGSIRISSGTGPRGGKGAPLNDCPPGSVVYIAEGIETALSALVLRPGIRVLAAVSLGNMGAVELPATVAEVVLIADADEHPQAQAALAAAVAAHAAAGRRVRMWKSDVPGEDLNDALKRALAEEQAEEDKGDL